MMDTKKDRVAFVSLAYKNVADKNEFNRMLRRSPIKIEANASKGKSM